MRVTADDIVRAIDQLPKNHRYGYVSRRTHGLIVIVDVVRPEGPIKFRRYDSNRGETMAGAKLETISSTMIWRLANAFRRDVPINVDRIFGGSYNCRSVLEALLAHTPEYSFCYPGRIEEVAGRTRIRRGHKHIVWAPDQPHASGKMQELTTAKNQVVSEVPGANVVYDTLTVPPDLLNGELDIEAQRRHAQIQIALVMIGTQLGYRTWVAQNDRGIVYKGLSIGEHDGVVASLRDVQLLSAYEKAIAAALLIDCMWFKNAHLMPAVMEIEHTTGVTSGLTRMKNFQDSFPPFPTRYVIVARDDDRTRVVRESSKSQFASMNPRFLPYSAVEELYALCQRRGLSGVTEDFLDCYMEAIV